MRRSRRRGADLTAQMHPGDPEDPHHPLDALTVHLRACIAQLGRDPRRPVRAVELGVDRPDLFGQRLIGTATCGPGLGGLTPPVTARPRHLQDVTQRLDAEQLPVVINELEAAHQFVSPAKYLAADRRMSRSVDSPGLVGT